MRVIFAGTPQTALPTLEALVDSEHEVVAIVTRPDARQGRGRELAQSPVAQFGQERKIPVLKPANINDPEVVAELKQLEPDIFVVVAYGGLIKTAALELGTYGWVNLHFSVLPAWRGAAPVQYAIMSGDEVSGATVFSLVAELDAGPVLGVITERIRPDDTAGALLDRLARTGAGLVVEVLDRVDELVPIAQREEAVSYAPKITVADAEIHWAKPAIHIERKARALDPEPGAWTTLGADRIKIGPVKLTEESSLAPGAVQITKSEVRVGTGTADVLLGFVQPPGKKMMPAADWARGIQQKTGLVFDAR